MKSRFATLALCALATALSPLISRAQQTVQIVNDDAPTTPDSGVWVLFAGSPANVSTSGGAISGLRNLAIPTCAVSTVQAAGATTVQAALLTSPTFTVPAAPFPIKFISGANAGTTVKVTAYAPGTGTLTTAAVPNAQAAGDQFIVGAYSQQLSSLPSTSTVVSPLSGATQKIYTVTANNLASAVVYVSTAPLTYLDAAPAIATSAVAYQTVELTTGTGGGATTSDLTAIDYFALPLQIESINLTSSATTHRRTFYFSRASIVAGLKKVGAQKNSAGGLYLGPGQVAAANLGNPSPFPSFKGYLHALAQAGTKFKIAGTQNFGAPNPAMVYGIGLGGGYQSTYNYDTVIHEPTPGNFVATLTPGQTGNSLTGAPSFYPSIANLERITVNLSAPNAKTGGGYDQTIYGAVLNASSFALKLKPGSPSLLPTPPSGFVVTTGTSTSSFLATNLATLNFVAPFSVTFTSGANNGTTVTAVALDSAGNVTVSPALANTPNANDAFTVVVPPADLFTQLYTNSVFSWAVADLLAGLDFGFAGSPVAGNSSRSWYGSFPQQFPYGSARGSTNDGFYNPWAAFLYNASDAYAFAFSDRVAPSPLMSTNPATEAFRITLLPASQIDAPLVTATSITSSEIDLAWAALPGVTYAVTTQPAIAPAQISLRGAKAKLTGLNAATPYLVSVQGTKGGQSSLVLPALFTTAGTVVPVTGTVPFGFSFTWAGTSPLPSNYQVVLNGTPVPLTNGVSTSNLNVTAAPGTNLFVLQIQDTSASNATVYSAVVQVDITAASGPSPTSFSLTDTPVVYGSSGQITVAPTGPYTITQNANGPSSPLVLGIDFAPTVRKGYAPVALPAKK
ncbi:MAG: hypothetical protein KF715_09020 [Candidatus Didemnitutus sp.]|nr:hypothetical protein [Candidatus Didemnitutus sp.]